MISTHTPTANNLLKGVAVTENIFMIVNTLVAKNLGLCQFMSTFQVVEIMVIILTTSLTSVQFVIRAPSEV